MKSYHDDIATALVGVTLCIASISTVIAIFAIAV